MESISECVKVANDETLGELLIAVMDIAPGETILEEKPLLVTPHWSSDEMKCSNCCQPSFIMCRKCDFFPLCIDCPGHNEFDCNFFQTKASAIPKEFLVKNYAIFGLLKFLLLLENESTRNDCVALINSFKEKKILDNIETVEREKQEHGENVVTPLLQSGLLKCFESLEKEIDAEYLHKLSLIIDRNAFEVHSNCSIGGDGDSLKGIYPRGAQLPHNCVPNAAIAFDYDFNMKVYAVADIKSGEVIFISYANPLMGTSQRQHHLSLTKSIVCTCQRCVDPTELGTHMSSLKCQECGVGYATFDGKWTCNKCDAEVNADSVRKLIVEVGQATYLEEGDLFTFEKLLVKYGSYFHPNHFLLNDMKQNISTILSDILSDHLMDSNARKKLLERKLQLSDDILPIMRMVTPRLSKKYATSLSDYLDDFTEWNELKFKDNDISKEWYLESLWKAKQIGTNAIEMLSFEPTNSHSDDLKECIEIQRSLIEDIIQELST